MTDANSPSEPPPSPTEPPAVTRRFPAWAGLAFVLLLMAVFVANQLLSQTGAELIWRYDLDEALREAEASGQNVFLVVNEPNCPILARQDADFYTKRIVRDRLVKVVCCRIELPRGELLPPRIRSAPSVPRRLEESPLMLALKPDGTVLGVHAGTLQPTEFRRLADLVDPDGP